MDEITPSPQVDVVYEDKNTTPPEQATPSVEEAKARLQTMSREEKEALLIQYRSEKIKSMPREEKEALLEKFRSQAVESKKSAGYEVAKGQEDMIAGQPFSIQDVQRATSGGVSKPQVDREPQPSAGDRATAKWAYDEPTEQAAYLTDMLSEKYPDHNLSVVPRNPEQTGHKFGSSFSVIDMELGQEVAVIDPGLFERGGIKDIPNDIVDFLPVAVEAFGITKLASKGIKPLLKMGLKRGGSLALASGASGSAMEASRQMMGVAGLDEREFQPGMMLLAGVIDAGGPAVGRSSASMMKVLSRKMTGKAAGMWMELFGKGNLKSTIYAKNIPLMIRDLDTLAHKYKDLGLSDLDKVPDPKQHIITIRNRIAAPMNQMEKQFLDARAVQSNAFNRKIADLEKLKTTYTAQGLMGKAGDVSREITSLNEVGRAKFYDPQYFAGEGIPITKTGAKVRTDVKRELGQLNVLSNKNPDLAGHADMLGKRLDYLLQTDEAPLDEVLGAYRKVGQYADTIDINKDYAAYKAAISIQRSLAKVVKEAAPDLSASMADYAAYRRIVPTQLEQIPGGWWEPTAVETGGGLLSSAIGGQLGTGAGIGAFAGYSMMQAGVDPLTAVTLGSGLGVTAVFGGKMLQGWVSKPNTAMKMLINAERAKQPLLAGYLEVHANKGMEAAASYFGSLPFSVQVEIMKGLPTLVTETVRNDPEFLETLKQGYQTDTSVSAVERAKQLSTVNRGQLPAQIEDLLNQIENPQPLPSSHQVGE